MEVPTKDDFLRLERSMNSKMSELLEKIEALTTTPRFTTVLKVKDVEDEFKQSSYNQRNGRNSGRLIYNKVGKEITYRREDVENWIRTTEVK